MTLDILRMDVSKELLRKMEKEERALFLALGHASNQVNALWKLVIILTNGDTDDPVKQRLEGTRTQVFVRLTIGAMWEAWRLVEDRFLKRPLGREYLPLLDRPAADALERLKKRFGKGSGLSTIRNNYAFHHPGIDDIDAAFEKAAAEGRQRGGRLGRLFQQGAAEYIFLRFRLRVRPWDGRRTFRTRRERSASEAHERDGAGRQRSIGICLWIRGRNLQAPRRIRADHDDRREG